jgi:hypothetical protein
VDRQGKRAVIGGAASVRGGEPDHADDANRAHCHSDVEFRERAGEGSTNVSILYANADGHAGSGRLLCANFQCGAGWNLRVGRVRLDVWSSAAFGARRKRVAGCAETETWSKPRE